MDTNNVLLLKDKHEVDLGSVLSVEYCPSGVLHVLQGFIWVLQGPHPHKILQEPFQLEDWLRYNTLSSAIIGKLKDR